MKKRGKHRKNRERKEPLDRLEMVKIIFPGMSVAVALARFLWELARS